jgi:hypothetical protein
MLAERKDLGQLRAAKPVPVSSRRVQFPSFLCATRSVEVHEMTDQRNILLIVADDMAYGDFECFNHGTSRTPTLDHLLSEGTCLTGADDQRSWVVVRKGRAGTPHDSGSTISTILAE